MVEQCGTSMVEAWNSLKWYGATVEQRGGTVKKFGGTVEQYN